MDRRINDGAKQRTVEDLRRRYDFDAMLEASTISEGEVGNGRYIKYGNGRLEFYSNELSSGDLIMSISRNACYSNNISIPLNLGLVSSDYSVDFSLYDMTSAMNVLIQSATTSDKLVIKFIAMYPATIPIKFSFRLVGRWK